MTEEIEDIIWKHQHPLEHEPDVVKARALMNRARELEEEAKAILKAVAKETKYKVGDRVHKAGKLYGIVGAKVDHYGRIVLSIRPMKKNGEWKVHHNANSLQASDTTVQHCDIDEYKTKKRGSK